MDNSTNTTGAAPEPAAAHDTATARAIDAALQDEDAFGAWLEAEADRVEAEALAPARL
jgi:hypothetical protein